MTGTHFFLSGGVFQTDCSVETHKEETARPEHACDIRSRKLVLGLNVAQWTLLSGGVPT